MMSREDLARCAQADINACNPKELVDLADVKIDPKASIRERVDCFLNQVRNPYLFKVDGVVVKVNYGSEKKLAASLTTLLIPQ